MTTASPSQRRFVEPPRSALALRMLTLLLLSGGIFSLGMHGDTAWEITLAQRCVHEGVCDKGVPASLPGATHGAFILRIMEAVILLKLPWAALRMISTALLSAAVVVAAIQIRSFLHWRLTWLTYALIVWLTAVRFSAATVWNISPHPLFCALFTLGLLRTIESGRVRDALLCTGSLGLAIDTELAAVIVLPLTCGILIASVERRALTLLAGAAAFVAGPLLFSARVWQHNLEALFTRHPHLLIAGGLAIAGAMVGGTLLRTRWQTLPQMHRVLIAMTLITLTTRGATAVIEDLGVASGSQSWYLGASWTSEICLALAVWNTVSESWRHRLFPASQVLGAVLVLGVFLLNATGEAAMWFAWGKGSLPAWSVDDVDRLAAHLEPRGMTQNAAARRLWTNDTDQVARHLASFMPEKDEPPYTGPDILAVKVTGTLPRALPKGWSLLPLGGGQVALIHEFYSQLDAAPVHLEIHREGMEVQRINTTKFDWQAIGEQGKAGISGARLGPRDHLIFQIERLPPRPPRYFLAVHSSNVEAPQLVIGDTKVSCHFSSDREKAITVATDIVAFPDLVEIGPEDREFLQQALPTLDWSACP